MLTQGGDGLFQRLGTREAFQSFEPLSPTLSVTEFGVPNVYWSTVLAHDPKLFTTESPESWRDFWNTTRFPGHRALYDDPREISNSRLSRMVCRLRSCIRSTWIAPFGNLTRSNRLSAYGGRMVLNLFNSS